MSCNETRYSLNVEEFIAVEKGKPIPHFLADYFGDYPFVPTFNEAQSVRYVISKGETRFGEYESGEVIQVFDFEYVNSLLRRIKLYDKEGKVKEMSRFDYDDENNIKRESTYNSKGDLTDEYTYEYEPNKMICYFKDEEDGSACVYDDETRCIEFYKISNRKEKLVSEIEYGNNGKVSQLINRKGNEVIEFKYDSRDRLIEIPMWKMKFYYDGDKLSSAEDSGSIYEYIYDSDNLPTRVIVRNEYNDDIKIIDYPVDEIKKKNPQVKLEIAI
jgi:hypothetical protein